MAFCSRIFDCGSEVASAAPYSYQRTGYSVLLEVFWYPARQSMTYVMLLFYVEVRVIPGWGGIVRLHYLRFSSIDVFKVLYIVTFESLSLYQSDLSSEGTFLPFCCLDNNPVS